MLSMVILALATQSPAPQLASNSPAARGSQPERLVATATLARTPPVIDGRGDDVIWAQATPITNLRQWQPVEDGDARYRTEARVAYDAKTLYVFVRAFDPHPDSINTQLARRDTWTSADKIWVMVDSYFDRRSGFEFGVNPSGVKFDMAITNDGNEDPAWDGVWDVATTIDSLGWTAEYRIPLSQLRYAPSPELTFGFMIIRDVQRHTERYSWPVLRRSRPGFPSQFGELTGLVGLASPRRLEATPYMVTKNEPVRAGSGFDHEQRLTLGGDIKYGITSNITLDATVNPDFGQVEADPSVLNLSAFETFFQERRPFFIEGTGIWRFNVNCSAVNCSGENLFYSRRIGRSPQLASSIDTNASTATTILGAAKISGRLGNGLSIGLLDAVTREEQGFQDRIIEPMSNYLAARLQQDFRRGESGVGAMLTSVTRNLDAATAPILRSDALVGALDFRHRFAGGRYRLNGSFDYSRVSGSPAAILATQTSPAHYFQRPDDGIAIDSNATSLDGYAAEVSFGKSAGRLTRFETSYSYRSPGFEINDLGFLRRADQQSWATWFAFQFNRPAAFYQRANWNINWWQNWTTDGMPTERAFNTNVHAQLNNRWWVHAGGTIGQIGDPLCDNCTRGGPAVRTDAYIAPWMGINGDDRKTIIPELWINYNLTDAGRSDRININPFVRLRLSSRFSPSIGINVTRNRDDLQFYGNFTDALGNRHYTFAALRQTELSMNVRFDYTMSNTLSLQVYAAPFISKGTYSNVRELSADPRAAEYDDRYQPYAAIANPGGFNFKQFNSNVVLRWEYRPGSALFLVWSQGRSGFENAEGNQSLQRGMQDVFGLRPNNVFLVKASYWLNW